MNYPKWVQREQQVGPVLCLNEQEEKQLLSDWAAEKGRVGKEAAVVKEAEELGSKEAATIQLKRR